MNAAVKAESLNVDMAAILGLEETFFLPETSRPRKSGIRLPLAIAASVFFCLLTAGLAIYFMVAPNPPKHAAARITQRRLIAAPRSSALVARAELRAQKEVSSSREFVDADRQPALPTAEFRMRRRGVNIKPAIAGRSESAAITSESVQTGTQNMSRPAIKTAVPSGPRLAAPSDTQAILGGAGAENQPKQPASAQSDLFSKSTRDARAQERREGIDAIRALRR